MKDYDVLIVGAGISGIGSACHLKNALPSKVSKYLKVGAILAGHGTYFSIQASDPIATCTLLDLASNLGLMLRL